MTMQEKVLAKIKKIAKNFGLEFVEQRKWANTGSVMLMDDLTNVIHFGYQFHDGCAVLQFYPGNQEIRNTCGFTAPTCLYDAYIPYHEMDRLSKMLGWLADALATRQAGRVVGRGVTA